MLSDRSVAADGQDFGVFEASIPVEAHVGGQVLHGVDQMGEVAAQAVELSSRRSCLA